MPACLGTWVTLPAEPSGAAKEGHQVALILRPAHDPQRRPSPLMLKFLTHPAPGFATLSRITVLTASRKGTSADL